MSEAPKSPKQRKSKRRFFRFGLKALLIFIGVIAVWLGIMTNRANRQRRAVEAITELGGEFWYDYQKAPPRRPTSRYSFSVKAEMPGPEWLRNLVGDHYFITPVYLSLKKQAVIDEDGLAHLRDLPGIEDLSVYHVKLRNEDLAHFQHLTKLRSVIFGPDTLSAVDGTQRFEFLSRCPDLQDLTLEGLCFGDAAAVHLGHAADSRQLYLHDTAVGDEGLAHFKGMSNLEALGLGRTRVTDAGLVHLKSLTQLSYLSLSGTQVTDTGLEHLKALVNLQRVELFETKVTKQGLSALKAALPNCEVVP